MYATLTAPTNAGAVPEESAEKPHHLKNDQGFRNPWPSWGQDKSALRLTSGIAW